MSLSNTATPIYYEQFREAVMSGRIPVCREVSMQMNRIDKRIRDPRYYYDDRAIDGFIAFCENELTLTDGSDLTLLDTFKLWAEDLFAWFYFEEQEVYEPDPDGYGGRFVTKRIKHRLTNMQYIVVPRGAAKSMYAAAIQAFTLVVNTATTDQVVTAPTVRQADETLSPIRTAITRSRGPLFKFMTDGSLQNTTGAKSKRVRLASTKKGIENFLTNSMIEIRPMTVDKLQGLRCPVVTIDEWLSGDTREDVRPAVEQGASKFNDYIIVLTSSEGTIRDGIGDTIKMELESILKGEYDNEHISIWYYKLDDVSEVGDPDLWLKANPNLGKTVRYEVYQEDVKKAEKSPSTRNDILAKRFNLPLAGYTYFFTYEETLVHNRCNFYGMPCSMGGDLSRGDDFCAFTFLFPLSGERFGVKTRAYISQLTYDKLPDATREKYDTFIEEGGLVVMDGSILDMMIVYDDLDQFIADNEYDVRAFGYDPYNAREFVERWITENGSYGVEKVIQGAKTESVPLGELKNLAEDRLLIFDQPIMQYCMGNCVALVDTNGNRKLYKKRGEQKIDCVAAMMDAFVAYKLNKEQME